MQSRPAWASVERELGANAIALLPGALTLYLAFSAGGFFAGTTGIVTAFVGVVLVLRVTLAPDPVAGVRVPALIAVSALALLAVWILLSSQWSHAPSRGLVEFDRALLYVLVLALFASLPRTIARAQWLAAGLAAAAITVCVAALLSRLLPEVFPTGAEFVAHRLSYPLTYWNALGLLAVFGLVLALHGTTRCEGSRVVRVLGAGAAPIAATTILLTFSRGAIVVGTLGVVGYLLLSRSRGAVTGLLVAVPAVAVSLVAAFGAKALAGPHPTSAAGVQQGGDVAVVLGACVLGAIVLRALLLGVDVRLAALRLPRLSAGRRIAAILVAVAALAVVSIALGVPGTLRSGFDGFVHGHQTNHDDSRARLTDPGNNGRFDLWRVSLDDFARAPARGTGAGTFQTEWQRARPKLEPAVDGHSLYIEILGELGLPGLLLLVVALLTLLGGLAARLRGRERPLNAALFVCAAAWMLHAGFDWDWEMPATSVWLFAAGGMALSAPAGTASPPRNAGRLGRLVGSLAVLLVCINPVQVARSQAPLDLSAEALKRGDCRAAVPAAVSVTSAESVRPEPYQILALCDIRSGLPQLALQAALAARDRDPGDWQYEYTLALVLGAQGRDPRSAAGRALKLNPLDKRGRALVGALAGAGSRAWPSIVSKAPLPID